MDKPYVVLCRFDGVDTYRDFVHEADALLATLGEAVAEGHMGPEAARERWAAYSEIDPEVLEPSEDFPVVMGDWEYLPGTHEFEKAVDELRIAGAGIVTEGLSPASGQFIETQGDQAFEAVRRALRDEYAITVLDGSEPAEWSESVEATQRVLAWARGRFGSAAAQ